MSKPKQLVLACILVSSLAACGDKKDEAKVELKTEHENVIPPTTPVESQDTGEAKPVEGETEKPSEEGPKPEGTPDETALAMAATAVPNTVTLGGCFLERGATPRGVRSVSTGEMPQDNVTVEKSEPTGGAQKDSVTITKGETSITVHHALTHNCCYQATVKTGIEENRIRVEEFLAGQTCRCMCHSTITTKIDLPGPNFFKQYHVTVKVDNNGTPGPTHEETILF